MQAICEKEGEPREPKQDLCKVHLECGDDLIENKTEMAKGNCATEP